MGLLTTAPTTMAFPSPQEEGMGLSTTAPTMMAIGRTTVTAVMTAQVAAARGAAVTDLTTAIVNTAAELAVAKSACSSGQKFSRESAGNA